MAARGGHEREDEERPVLNAATADSAALPSFGLEEVS
jgi:hypothetical protein